VRQMKLCDNQRRLFWGVYIVIHWFFFLIKEPGIPFVISHNNTGTQKGNEGIVQTSTLPTQSLTRHSFIYIHMWAENMVSSLYVILWFTGARCFHDSLVSD
jgi:hypothetical protein